MRTTSRVFDESSHEQFARISCDYNPIHVDPIAARRTHAGGRVVHGMHSLLWTLDWIAREGMPISNARVLKAQFLQPIYIGNRVTLEVSQPLPRLIRVRILAETEEVLTASLDFEEPRKTGPSVRPSPVSLPPAIPNTLRLEDMKNMSGSLSIDLMRGGVSSLFPAAVQALGASTIASLACSSCLVGMVVPGLHSMFSGLEILLTEDQGASDEALHFSVLSVVPRFRLVRIGVLAGRLRGFLETLSRMPPVRQANMETVRSIVAKDEFRSSNALVIGGSRGLGELTGKLIAAGGGKVILTYASGKSDAERVAAEVTDAGFSCTAIPFDVHQPASQQLAALPATPTHIYYFATPPIFRRKAGLFDRARFAEFNLFYLSAFFDVVQVCSGLAPSGVRVFYPSSSALDVRPPTMTEYSMSKAAAETLCADISKFIPGVTVLTRRLPRLLTDQTTSTVPSETPDAINVMLPIIRQVYG